MLAWPISRCLSWLWARQLGIPRSTLKHWLDGHHVGEQFYPSVREDREGRHTT